MATDRTGLLQVCLGHLDQMAERFPPRPAWGALTAAIRAEMDACAAAASVTEPAANGKCICCRLRPVAGNNGFCARCESIYHSVPSRVMDGPCDCGHEAQGPFVLLRRSHDGDTALCSPKCCVADYQEVMGVFLGIWHGRTRHA